MRTEFSENQLQSPTIQGANSILRTCVRCGICTAHCPTYQELGNEADSPRGRIYLIKQMLEDDAPPTKETVFHLDRCLTCLACQTICPSGVDYRRLIDQARAHIEEHYDRPLIDRVMRNMLVGLMVRPFWFRWSLRFAQPFRMLQGVFPKNSRYRALLAMTPSALPDQTMPAAGWYHPDQAPIAKVGLFLGCVQTVLAPKLYHQSIRLLNRFGVSVYVPEKSHCCGSVMHHMGKESEAKRLAKGTLDALSDHDDWDALVVNISGCGSTLKDFEAILPEGAALAKKTYDISEYLAMLPAPEIQIDTAMTVAYHPACTLQHGQRITEQPKQLLQQAGFTVRLPAESHLCCGSAGTYNLLQPEISQSLAKRKVGHLHALEPSYIATGNIGCMVQLAKHQDILVVHTLELLDWAYGGDKPEGIHP